MTVGGAQPEDWLVLEEDGKVNIEKTNHVLLSYLDWFESVKVSKILI